MKRLFCLVLALCLVACACAVGVSATEAADVNYTDVDAERYYYEGVQYCTRYELMKGMGNNMFGPDLSMSRAMFVTVLWRMAGAPAPTEGATTEFTDVRVDSYYEDAVIWAVENGIVTGTTATTFSPDTAITREMMCVLMVRYADYSDYEMPYVVDEDCTPEWFLIENAFYSVMDIDPYTLVNEDEPFTFGDTISIRDYALSAVYSCYEAGVINGMTKTEFSPQGTATRGQVATVLMRFMHRVATTADYLEEGDVTTTVWRDPFGNEVSKTVITVDEESHTQTLVYTDGDFVSRQEYSYSENDELIGYTIKENGVLVEVMTYDSELGTFTYDHPEEGYVVVCEEGPIGPVTQKLTMKDQGENNAEELSYTFEYSYDENSGACTGALITLQEVVRDGDQELWSMLSLNLVYDYNDEGMRVATKLIPVAEEGEAEAGIIAFEYAPGGLRYAMDISFGDMMDMRIVFDKQTGMVTMTVSEAGKEITEEITLDDFFTVQNDNILDIY